MTMSEYITPVALSLLPNLGGFLGGSITKQNIPTWFEHLKFPPGRPPNWLFAPVWTSLYTSMGYASYMIFRDAGGFTEKAALPLACYGTQLALNWAWTPLFFGTHKVGLAAVEIGASWCMILATIVTFHKINPTAAYLLLPYLAWVTFATYLNVGIWKLNKDRKD